MSLYWCATLTMVAHFPHPLEGRCPNDTNDLEQWKNSTIEALNEMFSQFPTLQNSETSSFFNYSCHNEKLATDCVRNTLVSGECIFVELHDVRHEFGMASAGEVAIGLTKEYRKRFGETIFPYVGCANESNVYGCVFTIQSDTSNTGRNPSVSDVLRVFSVLASGLSSTFSFFFP